MRFHHEHLQHRLHHLRERGGDPRFGGGFRGRFPLPPDAPFPPEPPGFPGHGRGHGRGRQRKGNVRVAVLTLLVERPMHGYEMIQEIGRRTDGLWRPSPGSVYPTLQLLADEGLVSVDEEAGGKKLFTLTETGRAEAAKHEGTPPWQQVNDELDGEVLKLLTASRNLGAAMQQMAYAGTREQKSRAVAVLDEARRRLYAILGELDVEDDTDE
ncbi:PadR family transcriptional regulator [Saccharothrix syringae]|uniref:PadR family transcriptional regulator n=1 Tax=Saccharothrix syringae TaxID=103733 RepID=A0A5Q0H9V0_SACSY|nr:PadR family transcriptional regulator [Saccharothrix syringae]QFZ22724.1 PadR family transcriptional regulator [Saccharothrix syringae]